MSPFLCLALKALGGGLGGGLLGMAVFAIVGWHWYTLPIVLLVALAWGIAWGIAETARRRS